jgi:hypothetical protein
MRRVVCAALVGLAGCAAGNEPVEQPVQAVAPELTDPPAPELPEPREELPPISEILYENHAAYTYPPLDLETAGGTFPYLTIYNDGTVLRTQWDQPGHKLLRARMPPAQLDELRSSLLALEPFDRVVKTRLECPQDQLDVFSSAEYHVDNAHLIRTSDGQRICLLGCPREPADMLATFIELEALLRSLEQLESTPWEPTRGHVAVWTFETKPGPLPWAASVQPEVPYAWALAGEDFAAAWAAAGHKTGRRDEVVDGWRYAITVVPWRPGEDLHDTITRYSGLDDRPTVCEGLPIFPISRRPRTP